MVAFSLLLNENGGPKTRFYTEFRIEKSKKIGDTWWGFWIGYWVLKSWREWLWEWEIERDQEWASYAIRLLGLEIVWQRKS